jgi:hypothetical protein
MQRYCKYPEKQARFHSFHDDDDDGGGGDDSSTAPASVIYHFRPFDRNHVSDIGLLERLE